MPANGQATFRRPAAPWNGLWIGLLTGFSLLGCGADPAPPPETSSHPTAQEEQAEVRPQGSAQRGTGAARSSNEESPEGFLGVVVTRDVVDVAAETTGRIESVAVQVGDTVAPRDVLAQIDTSEVQQDLGMARASLRAAKAEVQRIESQVREAETRYSRRSGLPDIFSREEVEAARMEQETAQATLEAAQARVTEQETQVEQLRNRLQRTEIRAPFAGTVALRYLDPGATVLPGTPVVRLLGTEELVVRFAVPPEEVDSLGVGDALDVALGEDGLRAPAIVQHIAPEIDGPSQMIFIEARLDAPQDVLAGVRSGLAVRVFGRSGRPGAWRYKASSH